MKKYESAKCVVRGAKCLVLSALVMLCAGTATATTGVQDRLLPSGYTVLEAIASTKGGNQYINTGYIHASNTKVECSVNVASDQAQSYPAIFGSFDSSYRSKAFVFFPRFGGASTPALCRTGNEQKGTSDSIPYGERIDLTCEGKTATWRRFGAATDCGSINNSSATADAGGCSMSIFVINNNGTLQGNSWCTMTLYSFVISENGALKRDFVPCVNPSGAVGLYDLVTEKFYGNSGSGAFNAVYKKVVVTLDAQGGKGGTESVTASYGAAMPTIVPPTWTLHKFLGYFDADGKQYYDVLGRSMANWDKEESVTLTAKWESRPSYSLAYLETGVNGQANITVHNVSWNTAENAAYFSGSSSYFELLDKPLVALEANVNTTGFTIEFQAKTESTVANWARFLDISDGTTRTYLFINSGKNGILRTVYKYSGSGEYLDDFSKHTTDTSVAYDQWHDFRLVVLPGGNTTFYMDEIPVAVLPSDSRITSLGDLSVLTTYYVGASIYGSGDGYFKGYMRNIVFSVVPPSTVTLDAQGGKGGTESATASYGAAMPTITVPTKDGYIFLGYFDATEGGKQYYDGNGASVRTWDKTEAATLYAQWMDRTEFGTLSLGAFNKTSKTFAEASGTGVSKFDTLTIYLGQEKAAGDTVTLPTISGYTRDSANSTDYTIVINLSPAKTAGEVASEYLSKVQFHFANAQTVNAVLSNGNTDNENVFYFEKTGHYYQYVKFSGTVLTWAESYEAARNTYYGGRQGYLATVTSYDEDMFIYKASQGSVGWLGGTILKPGTKNGQYYDSFTLTIGSGASDYNSYWYWACGPECGKEFYDIISSEIPSAYSLEQQNEIRERNKGKGYYFNWAVTGAGNENNLEPNGSASKGEACLTTLPFGQGYSTKFGNVGSCTDADIGKGYSWNNVNNVSLTVNRWQPQGYLIEFGDQSIGDSHGEVLENRVSAMGEILPTFEIALNPNGGEGGTESVIAVLGETMPSPIVKPTRAGYTFTGYFDATEGGAQWYDARGVSTNVSTFASAATLYAQWKGNQYKYVLDGGSFTGKLDVVYGELPKDLDRVPVSEGEKFLGYFDEESHIVYDEEGKYVGETAYEVVGDTLLKAEWGEEPETIELIAAKQRWPWNGKVDVTYAANALKPERKYVVCVEMTIVESGSAEHVKRSVNVEIPSENGERALVADFDGMVAAETLDANASVKLRLMLGE